jgi:hypothetical protein
MDLRIKDLEIRLLKATETQALVSDPEASKAARSKLWLVAALVVALGTTYLALWLTRRRYRRTATTPPAP